MSATTTDLRDRIAATRNRRDRRERELLHATTAFRALDRTIELSRRGALDENESGDDMTAGERAVAGLTDGFVPLERAALADTLAALRELADEYRSTASDDTGQGHERAFQSTYESHLDTIRDLFDDAYETAAAEHVADFETANEADNDEDVETALTAIENAFTAEHSKAVAARTTALAAAIDADEMVTVENHVDDYRTLLRDARERLSLTEERLNDLIERYVDGLPTDIDAVLSDLSDADPVVLLPVALETRFARDDDGDISALQIRVYPDDIHIDSHESALSPGERDLGVRFWAHLWWASHEIADEDLSGIVDESGPVAEAFALVDLDRLPSDPEDRYRAVKERTWSNLVDRLGEERAAWVKEATAPSIADAATLLDGPHAPADVPAVDFGALGVKAGVRPESWTRAPYARLLPDRWIAFVDDGTDVRTVIGSPVWEPLAVGPDPDPATAAASDDGGDDSDEIDGGLGADDATAWLVDFERAKAVGMGMETPLTDADIPADGLDIVVLGVKTSMNDTSTATALQELFDAHHYTHGLGLLSAGTPTNNTDAGQSPFSSSDDAAATLPIECGPSLVATAGVETDGARAARLLAIDPTRLGEPDTGHVFAHVRGADGTEHADARQMNTALWSATWGYYAPNMLLPGTWVDSTVGEYDTFLDWLGGFREHFIEFVRAGGPFPTFQVGRQPYGLLPTTSLQSWGASPLEPSEPSVESSTDGEYDPRAPTYPDVTDEVQAILDGSGSRDPGLLSLWGDSTPNVPRVGEGNTTESLLRLLSMSATAYGYRGHRLFGTTGLWQALTQSSSPPTSTQSFVSYFTGLTDDIETDPTTKALLQAFDAATTDLPRIADLLYQASISSHYGATTGPLEPLVLADMREQFAALRERPPGLLALWLTPSLERDGDFLDILKAPSLRETIGVTERERTDTDAIEYPLLATDLERFYDEIAPAGSDSLLGVLLHFATLQEYASARVRLDRRFRDEPHDSLDRSAAAPLWELLPEPEVYEDLDESLLDMLDDTVPPALATHPELDEDATFRDALAAAREVIDPALEIDSQFQAFMGALDYFAERDPKTVDLERLFTETMDLATHRVDAWATSLATRRLETLRATQAAADEGGIHVGGYGAVTELKPAEHESPSAGYLHAPSLSQSTTAAVLRSGHMTMEGERRNLLELELSAERVRTAKQIFDGLRTGQSLGALLGYRFERELHERGLDVYIPEFRRLAPSVAGKLNHDDEEADAEESATEVPDIEKITDTVDGLALYRRFIARGPWKDKPENERIPWGTAVDNTVPEFVQLPSDDPVDGSYDEYLAIQDVLEQLDWTVDAVRDALVAESVHCLVTGRPMQAGASVDALARGQSPPELTFTETPRSGIGVTHRLLVLFDDPTANGATGDDPASAWPSTQRAAAEPVLNAWFASLLPLPDSIACLCEIDHNDERASIPVIITLADLEIAPLDLVMAGEAVSVAQRSTLEERIRYRISRTRGLDDDTDLTLRFDRPGVWVEEYPTDAFERIDPDDSVPPVDDLIELGAVLELARAGHELVSGTRPADATDLVLPGGIDNGNVDAAALAIRADAAAQAVADAKTALDPPLAYLRPQSSEPTQPDETEIATKPSTVERLKTVRDRLRELPASTTLDEWAADLNSVDEPALFDALEALAEAFDAELVTVALIDGTVRLEAAANQRIEGTTVAAPGTPLELRLDGTDLVRRTTTTVESDGSFAATVDLDGVTDGTTFTLTVRSTGGPLATFDGVIAAIVTDTPTIETTLTPPETTALATYRPLAGALLTLADDLAALATALDAVGTTDVVATLSTQPWSALSQRADWQSEWSTDTPTHVQSVLDLDALQLPGFNTAATLDEPWESFAALIPLLHEKVNPVVYDADKRAALSDALDGILTDTDRSSWTSALDDLHTQFESDLNALAAAVTNGPAGIDAATFALVESVRGGLLQAAELLDGSVPLSPNGLPYGGDRDALVRQATSIRDALAERIDAAGETGEVAPEPQLARLEAIFGTAFPVLPPFTAANAAELAQTLTDAHSQTLHDDDPMAAETWFARATRLREHPSALGQLLTYASALTDELNDDGSDSKIDSTPVTTSRFRLGQLPYREDDRWVGLPDAFTEERPGGRLSLVVHPALGTEGTPHAGLFVDEWVEVVPEERETTGLAFHYDRPGNRPPQSLLLAVPPDDGGWRLSTLKEIVDETFAFARIRTVDTDALDELGHFLPALVYAEIDDRPGTPDRVAVDFDHLEVSEGGG